MAKLDGHRADPVVANRFQFPHFYHLARQASPVGCGKSRLRDIRPTPLTIFAGPRYRMKNEKRTGSAHHRFFIVPNRPRGASKAGRYKGVEGRGP